MHKVVLKTLIFIVVFGALAATKPIRALAKLTKKITSRTQSSYESGAQRVSNSKKTYNHCGFPLIHTALRSVVRGHFEVDSGHEFSVHASSSGNLDLIKKRSSEWRSRKICNIETRPKIQRISTPNDADHKVRNPKYFGKQSIKRKKKRNDNKYKI